MNARHVCALGSLAAVLLAAPACVKYYDISVDTPIRARLDVSSFERVFVAGFISGGTDDVDSNLETTRLLRSQLRSRSDLRVIDADVLPLMDVAKASATGVDIWPQPSGENGSVLSERDLEPYKHVFTNVDYWKRVGEEYQQPLIVTGTILFSPQESSQLVNTQRESFDDLGRRTTEPTQELRERRGFLLQPTFVFIDGRTGTVLHTEDFTESVLYPLGNPTPALSSYFELMDKVLPGFLSTFSSQSIKGTRVLLR
jgi:hypothetical protein